MEKRSKRAKKKKKDVVETVPKMTFDSFFNSCVASGALKPWQRAEIWAFFKDNNLKTDENLETYRKVLKNY